MNNIRIPTKERYLSAREYLREYRLNQVNSNIEKVEFIPPQIGKPGFGKFLIKYKMPVLVAR